MGITGHFLTPFLMQILFVNRNISVIVIICCERHAFYFAKLLQNYIGVSFFYYIIYYYLFIRYINIKKLQDSKINIKKYLITNG